MLNIAPEPKEIDRSGKFGGNVVLVEDFAPQDDPRGQPQ